MQIVQCAACQTKNRIARFHVTQRAKCGRCGVPLEEPAWVGQMRAIRGHWRQLAITAAVLGGYIVWSYWDRQQTTLAEIPNSQVIRYEPHYEVPNPYKRNDPVIGRVVPVQASGKTATPSEAMPTTTPVSSEAPSPTTPVRRQCLAVPIAPGWHRVYQGMPEARFRLLTKQGGDYFFTLIDASTQVPIVTGFAHGGQPFEMRVPLGTYRLNFAYGETPWCGEDELFGESTQFSTITNTIEFRRTGTTVEGYELEVIPQIGGNVEQRHISRAAMFGKGLPAAPNNAE